MGHGGDLHFNPCAAEGLHQTCKLAHYITHARLFVTKEVMQLIEDESARGHVGVKASLLCRCNC